MIIHLSSFHLIPKTFGMGDFPFDDKGYHYKVYYLIGKNSRGRLGHLFPSVVLNLQVELFVLNLDIEHSLY